MNKLNITKRFLGRTFCRYKVLISFQNQTAFGADFDSTRKLDDIVKANKNTVGLIDTSSIYVEYTNRIRGGEYISSELYETHFKFTSDSENQE